MKKFNAFRPTLNAMDERSLMSATFAALPAESADFVHASLVRFNTSSPGTASSVADDVIIDGRIITAEGSTTPSSHELGHTLGFRHEHTRPTISTSGTYGRGVHELFLNDGVQNVGTGTIVLNTSNDARGGGGNDVLFGGLGYDGTSAKGGAGLDILIGNTGNDRLSSDLRKINTGELVLNNSNDAPDLGNDWLVGGTGQDGTSANSGDPAPYQGKRSTGGYVPT